jgi:Uma2 family endonuclease
VPDLVVEILSPSTARRDRTAKRNAYERSGVDEYWLVDPRKRQVTVFVREREVFAPPATTSSGAIASRVLPDLAVTAEELFGDLA